MNLLNQAATEISTPKSEFLKMLLFIIVYQQNSTTGVRNITFVAMRRHLSSNILCSALTQYASKPTDSRIHHVHTEMSLTFKHV